VELPKKVKRMRVCYGRNDDNRPVNTMVTLETKKYIYFGISRCNVDEGDQPQKKEGTRRALNRALVVMMYLKKRLDTHVKGFKELDLHKDLLSGRVKVKDLEDDTLILRDYLENIAEICYHNLSIEAQKAF
jgi:hypothetical protein